MIIDQARTDTFTYASKLSDWDQTASVRIKPRRLLANKEVADSLFFPPELVSESRHSIMHKLGDKARQEILVQRFYTYFKTVAQLEQDLVNRVILKVAQQKIGVNLPWDLAFDAHKIYTDESYHSLCSVDLEHQVELATGMKAHPMGVCHCLARLEELTQTAAQDLRLLTDIFATGICEMLVTSTLSDIANNTQIVSTVREIVADHIEDEEKHFVYFSKLLEFLWTHLDESGRQEIGRLLPQFILAFLEPDYTAIERTLAGCGLNPAEVKQIIDESYPYPQVLANMRWRAKATLQHLESMGIFENQQIVQAFEISGLID
jgi:P-aminobenzoate N-oxygenase AurF